MVGADANPEFIVEDSFSKWLSQNGGEAFLILIFGILLGLLIARIFSKKK